MASINLDALDLDGLMALQQDVQVRIRAKQNELRKDVLSQIQDLMAKADLTPADLGARSQAKAKAKGGVAKYRSKDGEKTWSGKGRKPGWAVEYLAQGGNLDDLLI